MSGMQLTSLDPAPEFCSFCGTAKSAQLRFVGGPGVAICARCVQRIGTMLAAATDEPVSGSAMPWVTMSDNEVLEHLPEVAAVQQRVEKSLAGWVAIARERKISWEKIGAALGMTRQSAWERFRHAS
ncbi:ClpX C4-type zinc finger protein [Glutamicibacter uratoxydans]|uniref:ClpX C4-type zinc finger protein n=1 Tax=Glutamicibacter uratoxydans TaxID=43667 RepID=UPI003D6FA9B8